MTSNVAAKVQKILEATVAGNGTGLKTQMAEIENSLKTISARIVSLLALAESGVKLDEITVRLRDLESIKDDLEKRKQQLETVKAEKRESLTWADQVARFFKHFEDRVLAASLAEQKVLLRKMVQRIVVDREKKVVRLYAWRLPKRGMRQIDDLLASEIAGQKCVFQTSVSPTRFELVLEA